MDGASRAGDGEVPGEDAVVRLLHLPLRARARLDRHVEGLLREFALVRIGDERDGPASTVPARLLELAVEAQTTYAPYRAQRAGQMDEALAAGEEFFDAVYTTSTRSAGFVRGMLEVLEEADRFCAGEHLLTLPADAELVAFRRWVFGQILTQLAGGAAEPWRAPGGSTGPAEGAGATEGAGAAPAAAREAPSGPGAPAGEVVGAPLVLDPVADAVARARRHVRRALRDLDAVEVEDSAELAVSELVTNAVLHARTPLTLAVRATPAGGVRVEVADASPVPLRVRRLGAAATTGRGLLVVEALSSEWGVEPLPAGPGKTVWFVPLPGAGDPGLDADAWAAEVEALS